MAIILLVDDHDANRAVAAALLRRKDHLVLEATDTDSARELLYTGHPDLVLVDVLMATLNGFPFAMRRQGADLPQTRFLFSAPSFLMAEARALAKACGISHVVAKPFESQETLDAVSASLGGRAFGHAAWPGRPSIERLLAAVSEKLRRGAVQLDLAAGQLEQRLADSTAHLGNARAALEQEVSKRLWAEDELTHANRRLHEQAMRDVLTGLFNRRYLMESFERELHRARRSRERLGVMIIDIDHFKRFNDTYGHAAGDAVLHSVASYMLSMVRGEDILCRYGGEEFVLVQVRASADAVLQRAETFRQEIEKHEIAHDGRRLGPVTLSIGVSTFPDHGTDTERLLQTADTALYRAKNSGRNQVVMHVGGEATVHAGPQTVEPLRAGSSAPSS